MREHGYRSCLISLLPLFLVTATVIGQTKPRVHTEYSKDINRTMVSANTLYVFNSSQQFVQLQLRGILWGTGPLLPAEEVRLEFYSFAPNERFKKQETRKIELTADGKTINLDRLEYKTASGEKVLPMLPSVAQVNGKLVLETLIVKVTPEFIPMLINANAIEFRMGDAKFGLNDDHRTILKEFETYVLPSGDISPTPASGIELIEPALPAELNNVPLATVLKWLRSKLQETATTSERGRITRFLPGEFGGCQISYRVASDVRATEAQVDLSQLDQALIKAVSYDGRAYVYLRTKKGSWGSSITLVSPKPAPAITAAFKQAALLCQTGP